MTEEGSQTSAVHDKRAAVHCTGLDMLQRPSCMTSEDSEEPCIWCFDLLRGPGERLTHAIFENDGLVLIWHTSVHDRTVPEALHVRLCRVASRIKKRVVL